MSADLSAAVTGPVDVEAIAVKVLAVDPDVVAFLDDLGLDPLAHVSTELPANLPLPRLRPWHGGGIAVDHLGRLNRARLNLDAWAEAGEVGKGQAFDLIALGIVALHRIAGDAFDEGVVTDVRTISLPIWTPDEGTDLSRYYATVEVFAHRTRAPGAGSGS